MLFKSFHIPLICLEIKTATRRVWKRPMAKVGGTYAAQGRRYQPRIECPLIKALEVFEQPLGDMTEEDAKKEGGYTLKEFKLRWPEINKIPWYDEDVVWVVEFKYIGWKF